MSTIDRRKLLKEILGTIAQATGSIVVASATFSISKAEGKEPKEREPSADDIQQRADRLVLAERPLPEVAEAGINEFLNGGFRNTPWGGFRNAPFGAFRNSPLGAFRNLPVGGFRNLPGAVF